MLKKLLAPVQQWLLVHDQCVGCGRSLKNLATHKIKGKDLVFCKCGRIYVREKDRFRRALFEEV